jgi:hypothetical protein
LLSIVVLEELISEPENYRARAQLALELCDSTRPIKPTQILLTDTLRSYAHSGIAAAPIFRGTEQWRWVTDLPSLILGGAPSDIADRRDAIQRARQQIGTFHLGMMEGQKRIAAMFQMDRGVLADWTFSDFWNQSAVKFAEGLASRACVLTECRARGITGLLEIPSVCMAVGSSLSLVFAQMQEKGPQHPRPQDSRDLQHAVMAASRATLLVTDDKKLARVVKRVPMKMFNVESLADFLARLRTAH